MREALLLVLLVVAAGLVVAGVAMWSAPAGLVVAGGLLAGLAWLALVEAG